MKKVIERVEVVMGWGRVGKQVCFTQKKLR
jgi:hypothetical protein